MCLSIYLVMDNKVNIFGGVEKLFKDPFGSIKESLILLPTNPSALILVLVNIFFIMCAIILNVTLGEVFFVYWIQSIIIGFFTIVKMIVYPSSFIAPKTASADAINMENVDFRTKLGFSVFFIIHYGTFHLVYLIFIGVPSEFSYVLFGAGIFFLTHLISFIINYRNDISKKSEIFKIMMGAYPRILPMHIGIVFGTFVALIVSLPLLLLFGESVAVRGADIAVMCLFLFLKTAFDLVAHDSSHNINKIKFS